MLLTGYSYGDTSEYRIREVSTILFRNIATVPITLLPNFHLMKPTNCVKVIISLEGFLSVIHRSDSGKFDSRSSKAQSNDAGCLNLLDDARAILKSGWRSTYYLVRTMLGPASHPNEIIQSELIASYMDLKQLYPPLGQPMNESIGRLGAACSRRTI